MTIHVLGKSILCVGEDFLCQSDVSNFDDDTKGLVESGELRIFGYDQKTDEFYEYNSDGTVHPVESIPPF